MKNKNTMKYIFMIFISSILIISIINMLNVQSFESYTFLIIALLLHSIFVADIILQKSILLRGKSKLIEFEASLKELESDNKKLRELSSNLLEIIVLATEGSRYAGGIPKIFWNSINERIENISSLTEPHNLEPIKHEILNLKESMEELNRKERGE